MSVWNDCPLCGNELKIKYNNSLYCDNGSINFHYNKIHYWINFHNDLILCEGFYLRDGISMIICSDYFCHAYNLNYKTLIRNYKGFSLYEADKPLTVSLAKKILALL